MKTLLLLAFIGLSYGLNTNVHLFYYPWYGTPTGSGNGQWVHWNGNGITPPNNITSNYYPVLGAYDSGSSSVLSQHMSWIAGTGAGVIVTSWWGQGSYEDQRVPAILAAANSAGIKVAFHIEPYGGRTPQSVVSDVSYINSKYGSSGAYFRDSTRGNRPVFYVYDTLAVSPYTDWSAVQSLASSYILLTQTTDESKVQPYFSGFYNYAVGNNPNNTRDWNGFANFAKSKGLVWSPSIGPGYYDRKAVPTSVATLYPRDNGAFYDTNWGFVMNSSSLSGYVSITSFNEWHEGSMIEPATSTPPSGYGYMTFNGAYGKTGTAAQTSYLDRTTFWVQQFTSKYQG